LLLRHVPVLGDLLADLAWRQPLRHRFSWWIRLACL
jgi:hypothetical protein